MLELSMNVCTQIINLTILECKFNPFLPDKVTVADNKSNHIGM